MTVSTFRPRSCDVSTTSGYTADGPAPTGAVLFRARVDADIETTAKLGL